MHECKASKEETADGRKKQEEEAREEKADRGQSVVRARVRERARKGGSR